MFYAKITLMWCLLNGFLGLDLITDARKQKVFDAEGAKRVTALGVMFVVDALLFLIEFFKAMASK